MVATHYAISLTSISPLRRFYRSSTIREQLISHLF
jgi:hypothetical protein